MAMIVQIYNSGAAGSRIFDPKSCLLAELPTYERETTDYILHALRWRRSTKWEKTEWGYEAKLRRV